MKRKKTAETHLKLKLHRETLCALKPPDLEHVIAGVTSACRSGWTCCNASCNGGC
jgi:hypothetical protein